MVYYELYSQYVEHYQRSVNSINIKMSSSKKSAGENAGPGNGGNDRSGGSDRGAANSGKSARARRPIVDIGDAEIKSESVVE